MLQKSFDVIRGLHWMMKPCLRVLSSLLPTKRICLITPYHTHNTEPWCLSAAHEVASLIRGSRWRASKWEAHPGSMYVIRGWPWLKLNYSSTRKNTLLLSFSVFLYMSMIISLSLSRWHTHTQMHVALLLHILVRSVTAGYNIDSSTLSLHQKKSNS